MINVLQFLSIVFDLSAGILLFMYGLPSEYKESYSAGGISRGDMSEDQKKIQDKKNKKIKK